MLHPAPLNARYAKFFRLSNLMCCLDALYANFVYVRWFYVLVKIGQEMLDFFICFVINIVLGSVY